MSEVGVAPCTPTRSEPSASAMNVDVHLDETQATVDPAGKKRKENDVTWDMLDDAAIRAAKKVMKEVASESDKREQRLLDHMDGSVAKAVK